MMLVNLARLLGDFSSWVITPLSLQQFYAQARFVVVSDWRNVPLHLQKRIMMYRLEDPKADYRIAHRASSLA